MVNNLDNVLSPAAIYAQTAASDVMSISAVPAWFSDLEAASLYGPNAAEYAMAGVTQDIVTAWQSGDTSLALSDLSNALSTVADAYLNGYQVDGGGILGDFASALDPNAVADITSLLSGDLAPKASGWAVDLFSMF